MQKMKILFTLLSMCMYLTMLGQIDLGVFGGVSISKLEESNNRSELSKSIIGAEIGIISKLKVTDWLNIQSEIGFIQKGGKIDLGANIAKVRTNYSTINLTPCFMLKSNKVSIFGGFGVFAGYLLNNNDIDLSENLNFSHKIQNKKFDWGGLLKAGVNYSLKKGVLFIQVKYSQSVDDYTTILSEQFTPDVFFPLASFKNRNFSFNLG